MPTLTPSQKFFATVALALAFIGVAQGQPVTANRPVPDCLLYFVLTSASSSAQFDNRQVGCNSWTIQYTSSGFTVLSLSFQSADDLVGVPNTWGAFTGTTISGSQPNTAITQAQSQFSGYMPWIRATLSGLTGTGTVRGSFYGYRTVGSPAGGSGALTNVNLTQIGSTAVVTGGVNGSLGVGGLAADGAALAGRPNLIAGSDGTNAQTVQTDSAGDLKVVGTVATGAAFGSAFPVQVGGYDGANARTLLTDTSGRLIVVGTVADGAAVAGDPVRIAGKDGSGNAQDVLTDTSGNLATANASSAGADDISNTNLSPTNSAAAVIYQRVLGMLFDGSTWDRAPGNSTGGAFIQGPAASAAAPAGNPLQLAGIGSGATGGLMVPLTVCDSSAVINVTAGATTELIPLTASRRIRVCAYTIAMSLAGTAQFVYGTGVNCGTGTVNLTGAMTLATGAATSPSVGQGILFASAAGNAICLAAVTGNVTGSISYSVY